MVDHQKLTVPFDKHQSLTKKNLMTKKESKLASVLCLFMLVVLQALWREEKFGKKAL